MTNLSTSEGLETDPEFKRLKEIVTEQWSRPIIFDSRSRADVRALFEAHAQTLLKLERAKEALRVYAEIKNWKNKELLLGPFMDGKHGYDFSKAFWKRDRGDEARAALAYIEEGKE